MYTGNPWNFMALFSSVVKFGVEIVEIIKKTEKVKGKKNFSNFLNTFFNDSGTKHVVKNY